MKKILILIIGIGLIFGLVGIGTQAYFSDVKASVGNIFTAGYWEFSIIATADVGGSIMPSGEAIVPKGDNKTFIMTPDKGYKTADVGGSIEPSGEVIVPKGDNKTFIMTADTGYKIADVLVDGSSVGAVSSYQFTNVTQNHTIKATYEKTADEQVSYTITATADTGGSIGPSGEVAVSKGKDETFTMTADTGYKIADVSVDGSSVGAVSSYQFTNVTLNHTIKASFKKIENSSDNTINADQNIPDENTVGENSG